MKYFRWLISIIFRNSKPWNCRFCFSIWWILWSWTLALRCTSKHRKFDLNFLTYEKKLLFKFLVAWLSIGAWSFTCRVVFRGLHGRMDSAIWFPRLFSSIDWWTYAIVDSTKWFFCFYCISDLPDGQLTCLRSVNLTGLWV